MLFQQYFTGEVATQKTMTSLLTLVVCIITRSFKSHVTVSVVNGLSHNVIHWHTICCHDNKQEVLQEEQIFPKGTTNHGANIKISNFCKIWKKWNKTNRCKAVYRSFVNMIKIYVGQKKHWKEYWNLSKTNNCK